MSKTSKKHFNVNFKEKIWEMFWRELEKANSRAEIASYLKPFLTENEITILEKRLAAFYLLNQGESLRKTSEGSGLARKVVVAVKHGFKKPIPRPVRKEISIKNKRSNRHSRRRIIPYYNVSDKLINELRRGSHDRK